MYKTFNIILISYGVQAQNTAYKKEIVEQFTITNNGFY